MNEEEKPTQPVSPPAPEPVVIPTDSPEKRTEEVLPKTS
jgi:hypothetical protein